MNSAHRPCLNDRIKAHLQGMHWNKPPSTTAALIATRISQPLQYACKSCETITAEPVPPAVIDGDMAAPGLLDWVLTNKYLNHLPLYRLEQIAAREQVTLSRSTLAEWVGRTGVALQPLVNRLIWHLLQGKTLHADETPVAQLEPGHGKTRKAYLWAYRSNDLEPGPRIIVFDYQAGLSCRHAQLFL